MPMPNILCLYICWRIVIVRSSLYMYMLSRLGIYPLTYALYVLSSYTLLVMGTSTSTLSVVVILNVSMMVSLCTTGRTCVTYRTTTLSEATGSCTTNVSRTTIVSRASASTTAPPVPLQHLGNSIAKNTVKNTAGIHARRKISNCLPK